VTEKNTERHYISSRQLCSFLRTLSLGSCLNSSGLGYLRNLNELNSLFRANIYTYDGVSKILRTGHLERELQMIQLSVTRCSCIAIMWVSLASIAAITLGVASQLVFIVVVYFVKLSPETFGYNLGVQLGKSGSGSAARFREVGGAL
jgi:hypothetical protein